MSAKIDMTLEVEGILRADELPDGPSGKPRCILGLAL